MANYQDLSEEGKEQYQAQLHFRYQTRRFDLKWERSQSGYVFSHPPEFFVKPYYPRGLYRISPGYIQGEYKLSRALVANGNIGYVQLENWIKGQKRAKELAQKDLDDRASSWLTGDTDPVFKQWRGDVLDELFRKFPKQSPEEITARAAEQEKAEQHRLKAALEESKRLESEFESWKKPGKLDFGF